MGQSSQHSLYIQSSFSVVTRFIVSWDARILALSAFHPLSFNYLLLWTNCNLRTHARLLWHYVCLHVLHCFPPCTFSLIFLATKSFVHSCIQWGVGYIYIGLLSIKRFQIGMPIQVEVSWWELMSPRCCPNHPTWQWWFHHVFTEIPDVFHCYQLYSPSKFRWKVIFSLFSIKIPIEDANFSFQPVFSPDFALGSAPASSLCPGCPCPWRNKATLPRWRPGPLHGFMGWKG